MSTGTEIFECKHGSASIIFDARYFPIIITTLMDAPTLPLAEAYFRERRPFLERAAAEGTKAVLVSNLTHSGTPAATVRRHFGEGAKAEDPQLDGLLCYIVVIPSAVMRGVITALQWIVSGQAKPTEYASTLSDALAKAMANLQDVGVKPPSGLDPAAYVVPAVAPGHSIQL